MRLTDISSMVLANGGQLTATLTLETVFKVFEDMEKNEGRGAQVLRYTVHDKATADMLSYGLGPMGSPGSVREETHIIVTVNDRRFAVSPTAFTTHTRDSKAALVVSALGKLTADERMALLGGR